MPLGVTRERNRQGALHLPVLAERGDVQVVGFRNPAQLVFRPRDHSGSLAHGAHLRLGCSSCRSQTDRVYRVGTGRCKGAGHHHGQNQGRTPTWLHHWLLPVCASTRVVNSLPTRDPDRSRIVNFDATGADVYAVSEIVARLGREADKSLRLEAFQQA